MQKDRNFEANTEKVTETLSQRYKINGLVYKSSGRELAQQVGGQEFNFQYEKPNNNNNEQINKMGKYSVKLC